MQPPAAGTRLIQGACMPTRIEVHAFCLGVRLSQLRQEIEGLDLASPPDAPAIQGALKVLPFLFDRSKEAFGRFGDVAQVHSTRLEQGKVWLEQIGRFLQSPLPQHRDRQDAIQECLSSLRHLQTQLLDDALTLPPAGNDPKSWFELGQKLAEFAHPWEDDPSGPPITGTNEFDKLIASNWNTLEWLDSKELRRLFEETGAKAEEVFPIIQKGPEHLLLLPWHTDSHWPWFRIEIGLRNLGADETTSSIQPTQAIEPNEPGEPPVKLKAGHLGLIFDKERSTVRRDCYTSVDLDLQNAKLLKILLANARAVSNLNRNRRVGSSRRRLRREFESRGTRAGGY